MKIKWEYEDEEADDYEWEYETEEEEGEKSLEGKGMVTLSGLPYTFERNHLVI